MPETAKQSIEAQTEEFFGTIGQLIVMGGILDDQLNTLTSSICHLSGSPMVEPILASIEFGRKCAIVKARCKFIDNTTWRSAILGYVKKAEKAYVARNIAAHSILSREGDDVVLRPTGAYKLLSGINLEKQDGDKTDISTMKRYVEEGYIAISEGTNLIPQVRALNELFLSKYKFSGAGDP